jgi:hypothetical protein
VSHAGRNMVTQTEEYLGYLVVIQMTNVRGILDLFGL